MREFTDDAIVLRTYTAGEADRVGVLWTRQHGKVRVLAKGVRKTTSRMGGSLEPMSLVTVRLTTSRTELYITQHVTHLARLTTLRGDYARISAGLAVVEVMDAIPIDNVADEGLYVLTSRVLLALDNPAYSPTLVVAAYFLKLLAYDGSAPVVECCAQCQSAGPLVAFAAMSGGLLCAQCRSGSAVSAAAVHLLQRIMGGDLASLLRASDIAGQGEVQTLATQAMEDHLGRRLRATRQLSGLIYAEEERP